MINAYLLSKAEIHINSQVTFAIDLYSISAEDLDTACCFLDFYETRESPIKTQKPVTDLLVSRKVAQSASAKAFSSTGEEEEKKIP